MKDERFWQWAWADRPTSEAEFDRMMASLDQHLAALELLPSQRPLNAALLASNKLKLSGTPLFGLAAARGAAFSPTDILQRIHEWYDTNYGDKTKLSVSPGSIVVAMHGNLWELEMPRAYGSIRVFVSTNLDDVGNPIGTSRENPATMNLLRSVKGLTRAHASRMTDSDLGLWVQAFNLGFPAIDFLDSLEGHHFFAEARGDYRHSVAALLSGEELGKARWETAQCMEKVLKGLLALAGHSFPTGGKKGHDIEHIGELVCSGLGTSLQPADLRLINCPPAVRYGDLVTTRHEALAAHTALLTVLAALAKHGRLAKTPA